MKTCFRTLSLATVLTAALVLLASPAYADGGLDEELEQYWATERDMDVLQYRMYQREGRISAGLFTGLLSSEPNFYYFPVGLRGGYHLSNYFGVEVGGAFMDAGFLTHDTELTEFLRERRRDAFDPAMHFTDRFLWRANAIALWSPFYGKLALLQRKLAHFDLNMGAGLGAVGVERPAADRNSSSNTITPEVVFAAGAHFYVDRNIVIRLDGRGYLYRGAEVPTNTGSFVQQLNFPMEFLLGASYLF